MIIGNEKYKKTQVCLKEMIFYNSGENFFKICLEKIPQNANVIFISDKKIWENCRDFFPKEFFKKIGKSLFLKNPKADEKTLKKIDKNLRGCDFILAFGSGTINDLCKYTAAQKKISYAIIPSALSMNGYLSKNASITVSGHKKTLPATLPKNVFCNFDILKSAPKELTLAGIGDSFCFYSCWFDWYLSHKILGTEFNEKPFKILRGRMDFLVKNFQKFSITDDDFLKILAEILMLSGWGMTMAGGSYPASQSEHMIAHTISMKYPELTKNNLHGQEIAITTLKSAALQKKILQSSKIFLDCDQKGYQQKISKFFEKKIAQECLDEYGKKLELLKSAKSKNWKNFKDKLKSLYLEESVLKKIFLHFRVNTSYKSLGLSSAQYKACVSHAKFSRNRFTCLDVIS